MITVHMIGNAHLDPVWLWRWPAGVSEALATCRTACDLLDEFPQFVFTRSDVWVHEQIEEQDAELFARIRNHAASGRWAVVGGWYIQPDCNFPLEESFQRHFAEGRRYFREKLGVEASVGYNVDSFGHAGSLPRMLRDHGFDSYVMMRPAAHEKRLPAELFRWRSPREAGGGEVITWRIADSYCTSAKDLSRSIEASVRAAVPGIDHVMCFYGVGDHGGGPTREQIRWIIENQDGIPGARLLFSHPRAFFDAVKPQAALLPVMEGELQFHAIGCYSVVRGLKTSMRAAEHGLHMARQALEAFPADAPADGAEVESNAWKKVLFNQFHDIYGGSSIPEACDDALAQLGAARSCAESLLHSTLFRHAVRLPPARDQRVLAFNASNRPFDGYLCFEPSLHDRQFDGGFCDEAGRPVPVQIIPSSATVDSLRALLWKASLKPRELATFFIRQGAAATQESDLQPGLGEIANGAWEAGGASGSCLTSLRSRAGAALVGVEGIRVRVFDDQSDTWSHGIDRYTGKALGDFEASAAVVEETGPVRASLRVDARFGASSLSLWVRLYNGDPRIELVMRLDWRERMRLAKLFIPLVGPVRDRLDGIPGGGMARPQDGREYPLVDWTVARLARGGSLGVSCPDCSALDGGNDEVHLTLARSPVYAWHDPAKLAADRAYRFTDQGEHLFRITLLPGADAQSVERIALACHRPPVCIDWTKGM